MSNQKKPITSKPATDSVFATDSSGATYAVDVADSPNSAVVRDAKSDVPAADSWGNVYYPSLKK